MEKCCYCGKEIKSIYDRNNPDDYSKDFLKKYKTTDVCCNDCNSTIVIPNRIANFSRREN